MADRETIHTEVARIKQLRADYDALIMDINSHRTIEAYHKWYDESSVVFSHYFDDNCKEYGNFTCVDNNGNGYVLNGNYQKIRKDFCNTIAINNPYLINVCRACIDTTIQ